MGAGWEWDRDLRISLAFLCSGLEPVRVESTASGIGPIDHGALRSRLCDIFETGVAEDIDARG